MLEGGAAGKVVALLPFLLLDNEKRIFYNLKQLTKHSYSHMWEMQPAEKFMSQLTPTYIYRSLKSVRANAWIT